MIIKLTQSQAEELGLVTCKCGHPNNNHFDDKKGACAHCKCKKYHQVLRRGLKLVSQAEELGLVTCECGHPNNNHFDDKKGACAHCKCKKYHQVLRRGLKLVSA